MKVSKPEFATLLLCAVFLAFGLGWFLRGNATATPIRVETERTLTAGENTPTVLPAPSETAREPLDINTATAEELATLPGIGEKRAGDIVAYRKEHGPFRIPEDITKVPGIGESTLAGLIDLIVAQ